MKTKQRESTAKFLYDLAKGIALLTVVSPWVTGQGSWVTIFLGTIGTAIFFFWAYWLEGRDDTI